MSETMDFPFVDMPKLGNLFLTKLDTIRETDPVFWSKHQHGWLITRHADIADGFMQRQPLSSRRFGTSTLSVIPLAEHQARIPMLHRFVPMLINNTDAPVHTRMRKLTLKAFNRKVIESVRGFAQANIEAALDAIETSPDIEMNRDVARPITGQTILNLLGIPHEYLGKLGNWAERIGISIGSVNPPIEQIMGGESAIREIYDLFSAEIEKRRQNPKLDIFTTLLQAVDEGEQLTQDEMIGISIVLLIAGYDTTLNSMVLGVEALSRQAELRDWLHANPDGGNAAAIELSRVTAMSSFETRIATEDFTWHDKTILAGDIVYLMIAAGNRDPRVFENPAEIDFSRDNSAVPSWGPGLHHCVGHLLAKMQLAEFFTRAYRRYEQIEVIEPDLRYGPAPSFRSFPTMHVRLHPRPA
jgi:pimeloyl-[acyl-carrier protein] synthase